MNKTVSAIALSALVAGMCSATLTSPAKARTGKESIIGHNVITTDPAAQKSKVKKVSFLSPVIVDKPGYINDNVVARKQNGVVYRLFYNRKTGYYILIGTTKRGFIFSNGKSKMIKKGRLNTRSPIVYAERPGTIDKTGYVNDEILLPKGLRNLDYSLNYHNKQSGEWRVTVKALNGYVFSDGKNLMYYEGKFNVEGNNGGTPPPPPPPPPPPVEVKEPKSTGPKTCDELVKVWRPSNVPASFPITCVDTFPGENTDNYLGVLYSRGITPDYYVPMEMKIRRNIDIPTLKWVITHESWHYESFSWSRAKQRDFLNSIGANSWQDGDMRNRNDYISGAAEQWAGMGAECSGYVGSNFYKPLPGGCATIQKWAGSLYKQDVK